jgi:hypothetical protein
MADMILVSESSAVYNCAEDTIAFCLAPETFPVFWQWMNARGFVKPDYTDAMMQKDMATILAAIKSHPRTVRGRA